MSSDGGSEQLDDTSNDLDGTDLDGTDPSSDGAESNDQAVALSSKPDRTRLFQLVGGAVALIAVTAVVAVLVTRSTLQAPEPETNGRLRGTSFDSFNRANGSELGLSETGRPWQLVGGEWTVQDGRVDAKPEAGPGGGGGSALAVLDTGVADQFVQATFFDPTAGTGLVTRFQGPNNFIGVTFAPVSGSVVLGITVDGSQAQPSKIGSALAQGEVTLGVRTEGTTVIVYVNGAESGRQVVPELADGTRVGVLVRGGDSPSTAIDDVMAVPLSTKKLGALGGLSDAPATTADADADADEADGGEADGDAATPPANPPTTPPTDDTQPGAPTPGALEPAGAP